MRNGTRLGIDVGTVRIGVSRSDPQGMLALPIETVRRADDDSDVTRILALVEEYEAAEIVVGHPLALSGRSTASTADAVAFAHRLAAASAVPVRLVDERLSTVSASTALYAGGKRAKAQRQVVDQAAATVILQHALDSERSSGNPPGTPVTPNIGL
ncbi:Holliday junction resolvase RuvX [Microbacterium sp. STN6]|uniref:Holliday junction resolvase RuvX n=1 Tax=Microbacterium sp. STN6 TaxID=2995588 RepID=UPI002260CCA7|nr:Holliday junction resolvase RuvX [Microbacterium sp. STN6]MCX7521705.1 Holliday junction resolvase RuvX [Microbacterium sp. STN6]